MGFHESSQEVVVGSDFYDLNPSRFAYCNDARICSCTIYICVVLIHPAYNIEYVIYSNIDIKFQHIYTIRHLFNNIQVHGRCC